MQFLTYLQATLVYFIPVIIGWGVAQMFSKTNEKEHFWLQVPFYFGLGAIVLFVWALALRYLLGPWLGWSFSPLFFVGSWLLTGASGLVMIIRKPNMFEIFASFWKPALATFVASLIVYGIWQWKTPFTLNWDWYQHQTLATLIQQGNFSFFTTQMSDTFGLNSYPPIVHLLLAVAQFPADLNPDYLLNFWQALGFWHLMTVGLVAWGLGYSATQKKGVAYLSLFISIFVFDGVLSLTSLFFLPQTLAAVLLIGLLAKLLLAFDNLTKVRLWEALVAVVILILCHYLIGGLGAALFLGLYLYRVVSRRFLSVNHFPWIPIMVAMAIGIFLVLPALKLPVINHGESASYVYSLSQKLEAIERSWGYSLYILVPLGVVYIFSRKLNPGRGIILLITFGLGLAVFSSIPYALKLVSIWRFFLIVLISMGLWSILGKISFVVLKAMGFLVVVAGLAGLLTINSSYWKAGIMADGVYTHLGQQDLNAAIFLHQTYQGQRVLLVSDPSTAFIMEGLGGVDSVGGAYMPSEKRQMLLTAFKDNSAYEVVNVARKLTDGVGGKIDTRLLVLSGRTFSWLELTQEQQLSFIYNIWTPNNVSVNDYAFILSVAGVTGTKVVYSSPYITIFKI